LKDEIAINGQKNIKSRLREFQQFAILLSRPIHLRNSFDLMA